MVMLSPYAGAALDPPLWTVVPNKALSPSQGDYAKAIEYHTQDLAIAKEVGVSCSEVLQRR